MVLVVYFSSSVLVSVVPRHVLVRSIFFPRFCYDAVESHSLAPHLTIRDELVVFRFSSSSGCDHERYIAQLLPRLPEIEQSDKGGGRVVVIMLGQVVYEPKPNI